MRIEGARKLIVDRGGYRVVAAALGWPISTVHTFCRTDGAPEYRWNVIKALRKCIKVTDKTDIMPPPKRRRAAR